MNNQDTYLDEEEIGEHIYEKLIEKGYAPTNAEMDDIAAIVFDYLLEKLIIKEVE